MLPANTKAAQRNDVNYVSSFSGAMTPSLSDSSPDEMLPGDLKTARQFGQRVVAVTNKFKGRSAAVAIRLPISGDPVACFRAHPRRASAKCP